MYISSLYFSYATLTTVGFGDINATTTYERGVALIALSIGSAIFAGIVGTMSTLVDTMDELEEMKVRSCEDEAKPPLLNSYSSLRSSARPSLVAA